MSANTHSIESQLVAARDSLQDDVDRAYAQADELNNELVRVDRALCCLRGEAPSKKKSVSKKRQSVANTKPAAKTSDVVSVIVQQLKATHVADQSELKKIVQKQLVDQGFSRLGFSLRFQQAITSAEVSKAIAGVEPTTVNNE